MGLDDVRDRRTISFSVVATSLAVACSSFGTSSSSSSSGGSDAVVAARSVKCEGATCANKDVCCLARDTTTCTADCNGVASIACDDTSDCASGLVCCVDLVVQN